MTSASGGGVHEHLLNDTDLDSKNLNIAVEFYRELNSLLEMKPPISKDKMNHIVKEALKEIRHYKHVVYYVESFIKNCSSEYKIPGLYVIDAIIRNSKSSHQSSSQSKELYSNRFSKNMCKTFSILYAKCPEPDREKVTRVLQLWQKYNILDSELIDKLNRISSMANIDCAISSSNNHVSLNRNNSPENNEASKLKRLKYLQHKLAKLQEQQKNSNKVVIDDKLISEIHKLSSQLLKNENSKQKPLNQPSTPPITTKTEINKILDFENDLDSDSENNNRSLNNNHDENYENESTSTVINNNEHLNSKLKRLKSPAAVISSVFNEDTLHPSERFRKSIDNCAAWLKSTPSITPPLEQPKQAFKKINLPDMSQPPPPLLANYKRTIDSQTPLSSTSKRIKASTPPIDQNRLNILNPLVKQNEVSSSSENQFAKEKERDRIRRGLPNIREKHICICSKTLWLGHLSKTTTVDFVIDELTELLSPSSSNDSSDNKRNRSSFDVNSSNKLNNKNYQGIILDCQIIPPRGCAYVEFVDRKTASKCLERMKDGYRLDGNQIKVAWATNKGINKDRQIKSYWNVEVGCTYVPWSDLDNMNSIDFIRWAEGGLIDEDSIPEKFLFLYKKQMLQLANADNNAKKESDEVNKSHGVHDMELDTEDDLLVNNTNTNPLSSMTNLTNISHANSNITAQHLHLPPPPLPSQPHMHLQPLQIPAHLLNSDIMSHLRNNQPPATTLSSSQIDPNILQQHGQLQFLSGLTGNPPQPPIQDLQSAIAHLQQMNNQSQSRLNLNQQNTNQTRLFTSNPTTSAIPSLGNLQFADLINQQRTQQNQIQNHMAAMQQQQQHQPFSIAGNPHLASHFQLVQRPLLIPSRQPNPNNLAAITNLIGNTNPNPIQLLMQSPSNQQQQQHQIRNITAVLAAAAQRGPNGAVPNGQPFFLPTNQPQNNKIPQMIFLSEAQFQEMNNQQQHLISQQQQQQHQQQPTVQIKSPTVTSTTTSFADANLSNDQQIQSQNSLPPPQSQITPPPQGLPSLLTLNPKPLMDMSFEKTESSIVLPNESGLPNEIKPEIEENLKNDNSTLYNGFDRNSNNERFSNNNNSWRNSSRRSYVNGNYKSGDRSFSSYNKNYEDFNSQYHNKTKNWHQNNSWNQSNKRTFDEASYNQKFKSGGETNPPNQLVESDKKADPLS